MPAIVVFALVNGNELAHGLAEAAPVAALAALASRASWSRRVSTVFAALGLLTCSAVLVHLSGGVIELHFHFFVMVGIITLYQDWWPFLVAIGYVVVHHGVMGGLWPEHVFNHPAAINHPWTWAAIHGFFILGLSAAGVVSWRLNEVTHGAAVDRDQQLSTAQRVAHLGSWEWDLRSDRTTWSDELYRILGLEHYDGEPSFERYLARVHPEERQRVEEWVQAARNGEQGFEGDHRVVLSEGDIVWVHARGEVDCDGAGGAVRLRGTAQDITAWKLADEALEKTTARYRLLEAMASAANEATTLEAVLQKALDAICAHNGWPVGHVFVPAEGDASVLVSSGIWHIDEPNRFDTLIKATEAVSFRPGEGLVGTQLAGAKPVWVSDVALDPTHVRARSTPNLGVRTHIAFPVRLGPETVAVLEFFSTEALEPDEDLLETLEQVGTQLSRVAERERAGAQLARARDAAMESSRLKSEFLATMSHEIRTPMNGVIGLTGLLLRTDLDERQRQYAEGAETAGEALLGIINDILDFSKIEAGKLELEVVDFNVVQVVEQVAGMVAESARNKGLELVGYCYPDVPAGLRGDPARLRQVLLNLASNAVKFTEEGEVVVRARLVDESGERVRVRFEVADTGIGIARADQERLFEPFSQADASTTRRYGGTGLGLAISTQLVEAMGGSLVVESEPGRGSTFGFTLPLERAAEANVGQLRPFRHVLQDVRVLIVDDNHTNRVILSDQLSAWDMRPELAADGSSALERLRHAAERGEPFSVAVLDMCMPGMDGLELAHRIAADPLLAETPLVLLSSTAEIDREKARWAGIVATLTKPVRLSELYDALMRVTAPELSTDDIGASTWAETVGECRGHVLVVEDNSTNQMVARGILEQLGYRTDVAGDGIEAVQAVARSNYSAVLMDCQMPGMDGYTATAEIRRREGESRHVPIIAMTANAVEGDRERCLAAGMDDHVAKPVKPEDVGAALGRWVDEVDEAAGPQHEPGAAPVEPNLAGGPDPAVIDRGRLEMLGTMAPPDGSWLLSHLVEAFSAEAPADVAAIIEAVDSGDAARLRQGAHRLRGAAANVGATVVADLCSRLEDMGKSGRPQEAEELVGSLRAELDRAIAALHQLAAPVAP